MSGGTYRAHATPEMQAMGVPDVVIDGVVEEADPPRKLVHTYRFCPGRHRPHVGTPAVGRGPAVPGLLRALSVLRRRRVLRADLLRHLLRADRGTRPGNGLLTGVRLDPQLGSVGDLVATHDLVGFAAGEAAYTHWTVDGSNLVARLRWEEAGAPIGYDPSSGTYLVVQDASERLADGAPGPRTGVMEVATGELLVEVPAADGFAWVGDGRLAYWGREGGGVLDVASGRTLDVPALGVETQNVFADPRGATSWQIDGLDGRTVVRELDLAGGPDPEPFIEVAGDVYGVTSTPQGRVLVTHDSDEGVVTTAYDRETAEPLVSGMPGEVVTALSTTGRLVGADAAGDVTEFDVETLTPIASLPGARSMPSTLQFDDSGWHMSATAP